MARFNDDSDFKRLASAVCDSLAAGMTYGRVSSIVGAYISRDASDAEVDQVIAIATSTACPEVAP